ncbi:MAG TPA: inorganic diphosphatase [Chitinophagaceae bacterium]|nr:inorganic diphosphatase [Chitinophagaceae bacterium]
MKLPHTFANNKKYIHAIVETPKGCAAKYNFDGDSQMFKLKKILPGGLNFPFHFGFIPYTMAEDGDPVDVMILMDEPSWPGCILECKVLGVIEAEQTEGNAASRNDRIIAAPVASRRYKEIKSIFALDSYLIDEIINFLVSYNRFEKKEFKVIGRQGPQAAVTLIKKQMAHGSNT